ncbi:sodium-dependent transporter [Candidatus Woesearchaeota archaeon]|nr:sodium-dependent transporter [Candidatus Woesearchaeota archaeon]
MIFLFAAIGSAVGLGNVWRFPYLTYKFGGGAFLIPYLIALFVMGIPLLMLEFALGQKIQKGAIGSFEALHSKFGAIGLGAIISSFIIISYYAVVMAWALIYFFASFGLKWAADSGAYFFENVLHLTESVNVIGGISWPVFFALLAVWVMIYFCVWKGTKSVGKVVLVTMPLPIILLVILFIRGVTLPGSLEGIIYYLKPNLSVLFSSEVWMAAASQIFFTLSIALGIMIAYASYNKPTSDVAKNSYTTALTNSAISLFAGFVVFSVLGYMATSQGVAIDTVVKAGPGLAFVVFPQALAMMPWWGWFFSAIFFLTLLSLGIDSAFSLVEAINTVITDTKKTWVKHKIAFIVCLVGFLFGIIYTTGAGLYFLDIVDHFVTNYSLVIIGILECVAVGWFYGADKLRDYMNRVSDFKVGRWWNLAIKYVIPVALFIFLITRFVAEIQTNYEGYPTWAIGVGWAFVIVPALICIGMTLNHRKK